MPLRERRCANTPTRIRYMVFVAPEARSTRCGEREEGPPAVEGRRPSGSRLRHTVRCQLRARRSKPTPRMRCGLWISSSPPPSTGKAIKIASMIDEHTGQSLLNIVERSITAQRLTDELDKAFAVWADRRRCADGERTGVHFDCAAAVLQRSGRNFVHSARNAVEQRAHRIVQQSSAEGIPEPEPLDEPARSSGGDRGLQGRP